MCAFYPAHRQNLSIYNPQNYLSNNDNLTIRQTNQLYLRLLGGSMSGALNANNNLTINTANQQYLRLPRGTFSEALTANNGLKVGFVGNNFC